VAESSSSALDGERKIITVLFADIKGSMELIEPLDPEEARAVVDPALKRMIEAVQRYGGYVAQSTGDGVFALFGAPVACEDHPQRALHAALRMQEELGRYSNQLRQDGRAPLSIRVGVCTGEVVVRTIKTGEAHTEYAPIGHSTSLASRLQALASPGSIMIDDAMRKLVEGYFALKPLGPVRIKGVSGLLEVYEVIGQGPLRTRLQRAAARGYTKFAGRQREMETMEHAAELAKTRHGQIVAAVAEAGVGKSRLFHEFKARNQSGWMVLEALSVSHGKASAYLPVIDLLHGYFQITADDDQRTRREKVNGRLVTLDPALEDTRPYLFGLLGLVERDDPLGRMDSQIRRRRTQDAIKRLLLRESLNQPLMVIFEDLHQIDEETGALLNLLADSIGTSRVLLLVNYRPEYAHSWGGKTYYTQVRLDPLGKESADEMLTTLLGSDASLAPLKRLIVKKSEGNPLFMEEIYQALIEEGVLVRNGVVKITRPLDALKIPATVQAILAARIDRLPAGQKDLLETVAVIGKDFRLGLAGKVAARPQEELEQTLAQLQLAEFIYEQPAAGDIEYTFKHPLTQEAAYNSVLIERRKALHERVAQAIEYLAADSLDDYLADLAHHYGRSANSSKALEFLRRAGEWAATRAVYSQAIKYFTGAIDLLPTMPPGDERARAELALQMDLARSFSAALGPADHHVERSYARARALATQLGDDVQLFSVTEALIFHYNFSAELRAARALRGELLERAVRLGDPVINARAHSALGHLAHLLGESSAARVHWETSPEVPAGRRSPGYLQVDPWHTRPYLCNVLWCLGYPDRAWASAHHVLRAVREIAHPNLTAHALHAACLVALWRGNSLAAAAHSDSMLKIAVHYGLPFQVGRATLVHGAALAGRGKSSQGVPELRCGIAQITSTGAAVRSYQQALWAEALRGNGSIVDALAAVEAGLSAVRHTGETIGEAELHRIRGELLWTAGAHSECLRREAEVCLIKAIEVSRSQATRSWELRAVVSLARVLRDTDRREAARAMLAAIYNWFTEGFDTADLKDAKALLEELS
jgi:class 3 adenylate cyclase